MKPADIGKIYKYSVSSSPLCVEVIDKGADNRRCYLHYDDTTKRAVIRASREQGGICYGEFDITRQSGTDRLAELDLVDTSLTLPLSERFRPS